MKDIFLILFTSVLFLSSCKGPDKEKKSNLPETEAYTANCIGDYSTGEKIETNDKKWSLTRSELSAIINLSSEISENEWHSAYSITPCNIEVDSVLYKGHFYNVKVNGGSYLSLNKGARIVILGCDLPKCKQFFLKEKENMVDQEVQFDNLRSQFSTVNYEVDFNKNGSKGLLLIKRHNSESELMGEIDGKVFFQKTFTCDDLSIDTNGKYGQAFNLKIEYADQYEKIFRKIVIPVFYKKGDFILEKVFISTLSQSAKTGEEEWFDKEIKKETYLRNLDLEELIIN